MLPHESRTLEHAFAIPRATIEDGPGRPLTTCEKLACRVLLRVVGKKGPPLLRDRGGRESALPEVTLSLALDAMERTIRAQ